MSQEFLSDLEFALNATPFDSSDSDYDIWHKKADTIDATLQRYNIDNPALADQLKAKYLKEKPPDPGIWSQAMRGMIPGIKQSIAEAGMGVGASLSSPHLSAFQQAEKDGLFKPGMSYAEKEKIAKKLADDRAMFEGYSKGVDPSTRKFIPFGIHERPKAGVIPSMIGESLYDVSKNYADELKAEDLKRDKAETKEEYLARQEREGTWIDKLQAWPVREGYVDPPGQLARSYGRSVGGQVIPMAVGGTVAGVGAITRKPSLVNTGLGMYRAGTPLATSGTVAGSMYDTIAQNDRIESVIRNQIESQYAPEELLKPNVKAKIDRQVKRKLDEEAKDIVGRAFSERLTSPQTLLEFAGTFQQGGLITNLLANAGLEAGSEAFDSALEQTYVNRKLRELYRKEGKTEKEIDQLVTYDQIGKYKIDDWMGVVRGGTAGVLMSGPTAVVETGLNLLQDKRVQGKNLDDDKEMQSLKDEADDLRNAMNFERQVNLQEQKLIIEQEKTEQARLKNQTGDTAPAVEPVLDQQEVQGAYDQPLTEEQQKLLEDQQKVLNKAREMMQGPRAVERYDTEAVASAIGENMGPELEQLFRQEVRRIHDQNIANNLANQVTPQEQADIDRLNEQLLNPNVVNPLAPEQVAESQQQRTEQLRQEDLQADADQTLGVNPEDLAPVGPDQTVEETQNARQELSDAIQQREELEAWHQQNRDTIASRDQVSTDEDGNTILRSVRSDPDSDTETIPNPQEEGDPSILDEALPQEEVETATEPQRTVQPTQRLSKALADGIVALFKQRFPTFTGEINVLSNEDFARLRGRDTAEGIEGEYHKGEGYVDILYENIVGYGENKKGATDRLVAVLWHEGLGHKGLHQGLNDASADGKGYERFIDNVLRDYGNDPEFIAFVNSLKEIDPNITDRVGAEEFVVRKFAEGNVFGVNNEGKLLEDSNNGNPVTQGILENKFLDTLIASFKEAIGRDGINKGRLDDRQIRHIMLALKLKAMGSGRNIINPAFTPNARTEQADEIEGDEMFIPEGSEPQVLRSLGRNIAVRRAHNWGKQRFRWMFDVGDDTVNVKASVTASLNEIVSGRTTSPQGIMTYDRLIDTDPEFKQKVEALGINPTQPLMELVFDRTDPQGKERYDTTGTGDALDILSGVAIAGRELMAKRPDALMFTAEEKVDNVPESRPIAGRVRLYDRFADNLAKEFGYKKLSHVYEGGLKGVFVLQKPKASEILRSRRKPITGQDDFARRAVGKRYVSPEEFSDSGLERTQTMNALERLDEYTKQQRYKEGGRTYLPPRDNPQIKEIVDQWLEERKTQKQGQKIKITKVLKDVREATGEKITPRDIERYRNWIRREEKKPLRSVRKPLQKKKEVSIAYELSFGEGTPYSRDFPEFDNLRSEEKSQVTYDVTKRIGEIGTEVSGVQKTDEVSGLGFWEDYPAEPNQVMKVQATQEGLKDLINVIGYLGQQTEVYAFGPKSGARNAGFDFYADEFNNPKLLDSFYRELRKSFPQYFSGGSQTIVKGKPGIRMVLATHDSNGELIRGSQAPYRLSVGDKKLWVENKARKVLEEVGPVIEKFATDNNIKVQSHSLQIESFIAHNDWEQNPNGEIYIQRINSRFRPDLSRRIQRDYAKEIRGRITEGIRNASSTKLRDRSESGILFSKRSGRKPLNGIESYVRSGSARRPNPLDEEFPTPAEKGEDFPPEILKATGRDNLNQKLQHLDHNARARVMKDVYGDTDFDPADTEEILRSFIRREPHDRVKSFQITTTPGQNIFQATATLEDLGGGQYDFGFEASAHRMIPRTNIVGSSGVNSDVFEQAGFQLDVLTRIWNVTFNVNGSYSIENYTYIDPATGEEVRAKLEIPALNAVKQAISYLIEDFGAEAISFSGAGTSRTKVYDRGLRRIAEQYGYNFKGIGSSGSKTYYMQKQGIENTNPTIPSTPDPHAELSEIAWQVYSRLQSVYERNIELRMQRNNSTENDIIAEAEVERDALDDNDPIQKELRRGYDRLIFKVREARDERIRREQARKIEEAREASYDLFWNFIQNPQIRNHLNAGQRLEANPDLISWMDATTVPEGFGDFLNDEVKNNSSRDNFYRNMMKYGREAGFIEPTVGYDPDVRRFASQLDAFLFIQPELTHDPASGNLINENGIWSYATFLDDVTTNAGSITVARTPDPVGGSITFERTLDTSDIQIFIQQVIGVSSGPQDYRYNMDRLTEDPTYSANVLGAVQNHSDEEIIGEPHNWDSEAEFERAQEALFNIRSFLNDDERHYDLNEEFYLGLRREVPALRDTQEERRRLREQAQQARQARLRGLAETRGKYPWEENEQLIFAFNDNLNDLPVDDKDREIERMLEDDLGEVLNDAVSLFDLSIADGVNDYMDFLNKHVGEYVARITNESFTEFVNGPSWRQFAKDRLRELGVQTVITRSWDLADTFADAVRHGNDHRATILSEIESSRVRGTGPSGMPPERRRELGQGDSPTVEMGDEVTAEDDALFGAEDFTDFEAEDDPLNDPDTELGDDLLADAEDREAQRAERARDVTDADLQARFDQVDEANTRAILRRVEKTEWEGQDLGTRQNAINRHFDRIKQLLEASLNRLNDTHIQQFHDGTLALQDLTNFLSRDVQTSIFDFAINHTPEVVQSFSSDRVWNVWIRDEVRLDPVLRELGSSTAVAERLNGTMTVAMAYGIDEAIRYIDQYDARQILQSVRPGVKLVSLNNMVDSDHAYVSNFYLPDGSRVEAEARMPRQRKDLDSVRTTALDGSATPERAILQGQGLNLRKRLQYWSISFDRDGSIDIAGDSNEQHRVANGIKQFLEQVVRGKNPEGMWFTAFDPGYRKMPDGTVQLNPKKKGARIRVYKFGVNQIAREYGYTVGLIRPDLENGEFFLQRNDVIGNPTEWNDIEQLVSKKTGRDTSYIGLTTLKNNLHEIIRSFMHDTQTPTTTYIVMRDRMNTRTRNALVQAYDVVPDFFNDGNDPDLVKYIISDIRNAKPLSTPSNQILRSIQRPGWPPLYTASPTAEKGLGTFPAVSDEIQLLGTRPLNPEEWTEQSLLEEAMTKALNLKVAGEKTEKARNISGINFFNTNEDARKLATKLLRKRRKEVEKLKEEGRSNKNIKTSYYKILNRLAKDIGETVSITTLRKFDQQLKSHARRPDPEINPPTVEEATQGMSEPVGLGATAIGKWAHSVMNYLKGKHLGDLKDEEAYLIGRYKALGEIARMTELGERFYEIFKDAKNPREIYDFLTTRGVDPSMIPDARERAVAIEAKDEIIKIGEDLKDLGLLKESTLDKMRGQYLPRIYLTHLLDDATVRTLQGGGRPTPSQLAYLKNRRDIPKAVRELILREVKDPDYLVGRALMIPGRDIALINWFSELAQNPDWAYQPALATFDTLQEVENIINAGENAQAVLKMFELDPSLQDRRNELRSRIKFTQKKIATTKDKQLKEQYRADLAHLKDQFKLLKARKVTGEYLFDEAQRIRRDILPTLEGRTKEIGEALTARMEEVGNSIKNVAYDKREWKEMPKTKRFGKLKGMIVRREIHDDIVGSTKILEADPHDTYNNLFGEGGWTERAGQLWKWSKVAGNFPASHARNFISNLSLMHLGGVPGQSLPGLIAKALKEMRQNGEHFRIAKKYGLKGSSFSANELGQMEKEFTDLKRRLDKGEGNWLTGTWGAVRRAGAFVKEKTSASYELMEALGKTMLIIDGMNRLNMSESDAVIRAQKYLFDYSLLPGWARKIRRSVSFGSPFFTFYFKTLPVLIETAHKRPTKFLPYLALGFALNEGAKTVMDFDDDEAEALRMSLPEFLRNKFHVYMLPWRDKNGRVMFFDASYLLPWGMFSELFRELMPVETSVNRLLKGDIEFKNPQLGDAIRTLGLATGPFLTATAGLMTNKDPFTQRTIWNERDSGWNQLTSAGLYGWNLVTPTMLAGLPDIWMNTDQQRLQGAVRKLYGAMNDELNNRGLPKDTVGQSAMRFFGINQYGFEPAQAVRDSLYFGRQGLKDAQRDMRIELRNMKRSGKPVAQIEARRKDLMERIIQEQAKLRTYQQATQKAVAL